MNLHLTNRKLRLETLEERALLAVTAGGFEQAVPLPAPTGETVWVVNTTDDPSSWDAADDLLSLREAIGRAAEGDTIIFDDSLAGGTITLNRRPLEIYRGITIDAASIGGITLDADGASRVFYVNGENGSNPVELISLTITGGIASNYNGGGIYNWYGALTLTKSTVSGNTASNSGGGIYNDYGTLTLTNSTVSENSASLGGGIYNGYGSLTVTNSTVWNNRSRQNWGHDLYDFAGRVDFYNSIIANEYDCIVTYDGFLSAYNTLSSFTSWDQSKNCFVYDYSSPLFVSDKDYSLADNSQAIDVGNNGFVTTETDLAGNPRIAFGTVDLGAYECQTESFSTVVNTLLDVIDDKDGLISLREAVTVYAAKGDTVTFDPALVGGTIVLAGSEIEITEEITIDASAIGGITVDGDGKSRIFNVDGQDAVTVTLKSLTITGGYELEGGGIFNDAYTTLNLFDCTVTGNTAMNYGGGIINSGTMSFTDCVISDNYSSYSGGGFYNYGDVTMTRVTISGNGAARFGGGFYNFGPSILTACVITENRAANGGGINHLSVEMTLVDTLIAKNEGQLGGGLYIEKSGTVNIYNSTVAGNTARLGGGLYHVGTANFYNSIIVGNTADDTGSDIHRVGGNLNAFYSLSTYTGWTTSDNVYEFDPDRPLFKDSDAGDYTLAPRSQANGTGNNNYVSSDTDLAGNSRIVLGTVDLGAYELQIESSSTVVNTLLDVVDCQDELISLREAVTVYAEEYSVITFDPSLVGGTIVLSGYEIEINKGITIDASAIGGITIDGDGKSRIFYLYEEYYGPVTLKSLTITGGNEYDGGGIYNIRYDTLYIFDCIVTGNTAANYGGGIFNSGAMELFNCLISGNESEQFGGGLYTEWSGTVDVYNSTVVGNNAQLGGGVFNDGTSSYYNSIIVGNASSDTGDDIYYNYGSLNAYYSLSTYTGWSESDNSYKFDPERPLFKNIEAGDFTLAPKSQAIAMGNNEYVQTSFDLAGEKRITFVAVDLGAYESTTTTILDTPVIITGTGDNYVSYGSNRHQITWTPVSDVSSYKLDYSADGGESWTGFETTETSYVLTGLTYGSDLTYRVRALSDGRYIDSEWSEPRTFRVCPIDIDGDGDITLRDRSLISLSWLAEKYDQDYQYYADIDGNGDISNADRNLLARNWLKEVDDISLYPRPIAADAALADYAPADLNIGLDLF